MMKHTIPGMILVLASCATTYNPFYLAQPVPSDRASRILMTPIFITKSQIRILSKYGVKWEEAEDEQAFDTNFHFLTELLQRKTNHESELLTKEDRDELMDELEVSGTPKLAERNEGARNFWNGKHCASCIKKLLDERNAKWLLVPSVMVSEFSGNYYWSGNSYCPDRHWAGLRSQYLLFDTEGTLIMDSSQLTPSNFLTGVEPASVGIHISDLVVSRTQGETRQACRVVMRPKVTIAASYSRINYLLPGMEQPK